MSTIDERKKELEKLIAELKVELDMLTADGGRVSAFIKQARLSESFAVSETDAAQIIVLWEKYKGMTATDAIKG